MPLDRRQILHAGAATFAALAVPAPLIARRRRRSDELRAAVIGLRGRGRNLIDGLRQQEGVRIVALCDVDEQVLGREVARLAAEGEPPTAYTDMRRIFDRLDVDVVATATPNHWHALTAIWACQSGKDVYVEKPVSHNVWEGRQIVRAARRYGRIVQAGTQSRSSPALQAAVAWVREGHLGPITYAQGLCYKPRKSIGKVAGPQGAPSHVDYDLWCGPAPRTPLMRRNLHYDWHWDFATGNGDVGNQGIHQMDICRWFLGEPLVAPTVLAVGGRFGYADDANTPNTLITLFDYPSAPLLFEVRGLPESSAAQVEDWGGRMDRLQGMSIGCLIQCEGGYVAVPSYSEAKAYDGEGLEVAAWNEGGDHMADFISAVRSGRARDLSADIEEGHVSSALCHLGNVSYLRGRSAEPGEVAAAIGETALSGAFERMQAHLAANGVDLSAIHPTLGARLTIDPEAETIADDPLAARLLRRDYRAPFVVPEHV